MDSKTKLSKVEQEALDKIMEGAEMIGWTIAIGSDDTGNSSVPYLIIGIDSYVERVIDIIEVAAGRSTAAPDSKKGQLQ